MTAWYEDDEFWESFAPYFFTPERIESSGAQADELVRLLGVGPGGSVLDLCCGVGRHSIALARRGLAVTGVDRTRAFLDRAKASAREEGVTVEWVQEDMRAFKRANAFDGAINCVTSFGYFEDQAEDLIVARNLHDALKAKARLVIEMMGKEVLARDWQERTWERMPDGAILLQERKLKSGWDWLESRWTMIGQQRRMELSFSTRPYSGAEIKGLLKQAGFREVELFGSLSGTPYDHRAVRLVAVATK
ncbi:MAG TPA: methyltransferase domain-containing protein [Candidatus Binatus sp.]|uniref:class I SAM-dependent methyltransferase n=1 Tax=Candidatus Binatus sp. TaxID=2811406 RepID=UPI002B45C243|nr:methyltransferase domain-containing protein [Candidatus Binatus sp.]HKN13229.1 methyltransferase domain-containing protein [Candidatus Binatus sp.]